MPEVKQTQLALTLRESNLYAHGRVVVYEDGAVELERDFPVYQGNQRDTYYTVKNSDTLDRIAWQHYKDEVETEAAEDYWYVIADANQIENPLDLSEYVGKEILIPNVLNFRLLYGND